MTDQCVTSYGPILKVGLMMYLSMHWLLFQLNSFYYYLLEIVQVEILSKRKNSQILRNLLDLLFTSALCQLKK